jgi:hypothetical protein
MRMVRDVVARAEKVLEMLGFSWVESVGGVAGWLG